MKATHLQRRRIAADVAAVGDLGNTGGGEVDSDFGAAQHDVGQFVQLPRLLRFDKRGRGKMAGDTKRRQAAESDRNGSQSRSPHPHLGYRYVNQKIDTPYAGGSNIRFSGARPAFCARLAREFRGEIVYQPRPSAKARAMPTRYVIGTDGVIAYSEVIPDYTHRPDPSELLPVLDRLSVSRAA